MKNFLFGVQILLASLWVNPIIAQQTSSSSVSVQSSTFNVSGNCGMCKSRIEQAAKAAGAIQAIWDEGILKVEWNPGTTSAEKIMKNISDSGHDNDLYQAPENVYHQLPSCCHYERLKKTHPASSDSIQKKKGNETSMDFFAKDPVERVIQGLNLQKDHRTTILNKKKTELVIQISSKELLKAACCNLSESFQTNATVDVAYTHAATGTRQIQILGLNQKYTALTHDQLPDLHGLAGPYGLGLVPGKWISGIQLTKGGSSVTTGYNSITGAINTEWKSYKGKSETSLNAYANQFGRLEANLTHTSALQGKWGQAILLHGNTNGKKMDTNHDNFLDMPIGDQINVAYLMNYDDLENSGWGSQFGLQFLRDQRQGGQINFNPRKGRLAQDAYGIGVNTRRAQVWNKTGYIFKDKPYQSLGLMNQYTFHDQDSYYGKRLYDGQQGTWYTNLIFESIINDTRHKYKLGTNILLDNYQENWGNIALRRNERNIGAFAEYSFSLTNFSLVAGIRTDWHNLAGTQFSPRINLRYEPLEGTIFRASAGRGFRMTSALAEAQGFMASSRHLILPNFNSPSYGLLPESAWNYGLSWQQEMKIFEKKSSLVIDAFRTDFHNQVLFDLDTSSKEIRIYNTPETSFANSVQVQWDVQPLPRLDFRIAYKYYQVQALLGNKMQSVPFVASHRGFLNLGYSTQKKEKAAVWSFDTTLNWVGSQRLPLASDRPVDFRWADYSPSYFLLSGQISYQPNPHFRIYLGGENLTSYTQINPVVQFNQPFGEYFDTGIVYAPIMPAMLYLGIDLNI